MYLFMRARNLTEVVDLTVPGLMLIKKYFDRRKLLIQVDLQTVEEIF